MNINTENNMTALDFPDNGSNTVFAGSLHVDLENEPVNEEDPQKDSTGRCYNHQTIYSSKLIFA